MAIPLSRTVPKIARQALGKRGMAFGALVGDWAGVVGEELAASALPEKLVFPRGEKANAVLHLRVSGGAALKIQHTEPQILERINAFFGYAAVGRLKLVQAPPPAPPKGATRRRRAVGAAESKAIESAVADIEDPELRAALARIGQAIAAEAPPRKG